MCECVQECMCKRMVLMTNCMIYATCIQFLRDDGAVDSSFDVRRALMEQAQ